MIFFSERYPPKEQPLRRPTMTKAVVVFLDVAQVTTVTYFFV